MNVFDRIQVTINKHDLDARPIEFEMDADQNPVSVISYETTCPACGGMVQFRLTDVDKRDDRYLVGCSDCGSVPPKIPKKDKVVVAKEGQVVDEVRAVSEPTEYPFCDPISIGVFKPDQL